jgi:hypothetical protein
MRRIAVLSGLVLVGGLLGPSTAFAGEDGNGKNDAQWIAVVDQFALVLPDGETFTGEGDPGPLDPNDVPPVGTQLFVSEILYETEDGETRGDEVGRTHIQCTAQVVELTFLCDGAFLFDNGSQLLGSVALDFRMEGEMQGFEIAVTGGTGDWFGATGAISVTEITSEDEPAALYEADVVLPAK